MSEERKTSDKQVDQAVRNVFERDKQIEDIAKRLTSQNDKAVSKKMKKEGRKK